jgi:MOSC domain-containing protein YiiM
MRVGRQDVVTAMLNSGRCGWYLRVVRPGEVPTSGAMTLLTSDNASPTVAELHRAAHPSSGRMASSEYRRLLERAVSAPALSGSWRRSLTVKLDRLG